MEIQLTSIDVLDPKDNKRVLAHSNSGTLFGERKDYRKLIANNPDPVPTLSVGVVYSFKLVDSDGDHVLGVSLAYDLTSPEGALVFGTK